MIPKISVITATRNRASTLNRVYKSLKSQTFKNFEWIVCDDGSTDGTINLLKNYKKKANFIIKIFHFKKRAGKPKIDNFCVKQAKGEFVIFADSDDAFKKNSFSHFISEWNRIPKLTKSKTFGIISRVVSSNGKELEKKYNFKNKSISIIDLNNKTERKEKWLFIKKNILKKYKFLEIDYYVPEGILWEKISKKYNVWILDNCYRIFYSDTPNSVTFSKKINYTIGQQKSLEIEILNKKNFINSRTLINYYRYLFINKYFFNYRINQIKNLNKNFIFYFKFLAFLFFIKDFLFSKINNEKFKKNFEKPIQILN